MIVLGFDPGLRTTGYGCVRAGAAGAHHMLEAGVIRLDPDRCVSERLKELSRDVGDVLDRVRPDLVAVEGLFAHAAFPATAVIMAHARGVILLAVAQRAKPLIELKPALVKKFLTGSGRAEKAQVQRAVQDYFQLPELPKPPDVADALAIALCGLERALVSNALGDAPTQGGLVRPKAPRRRTLPKGVRIEESER